MLRRSRIVWIALGLVLVVAAVVVVIALDGPMGYASLEDLVSEMITAIEEHDQERLDRLCHGPIEVAIERLAQQHARLDYMALLFENRNWTGANAWKLGGHGPRYGHIHIDLVKQLDGKWYLKRIWGCR